MSSSLFGQTMVTVSLDDLCPGYSDMSPRGPEWDYPAQTEEEWRALSRLHCWAKAVKHYHEMYVPPLYRDAYEMPVEAREWVRRIEQGEWARNLVLMGSVGSGKTFAACAAGCLAARYAERGTGDALRLVPVSDYMARLKNFDASSTSRMDVFEQAARARVLILDDLGRSKITDFEVEQLAMLLDRRLGHMLPTIVTTNQHPTHVLYEHLGDYLGSRILGGATEVHMVRHDRRFD